MSRSSREILCGVNYQQIIAFAGMSQKAAAEKLGLNHRYFNSVVNRMGLGHWFQYQKPTCITKDDIIKAAEKGMNQIDTADYLGVDYGHFWVLVKRWGLRELFPAQGEASLMGRRKNTPWRFKTK